ncbi:hypothetical protein SASPL_108747 [Salvia splendens]|uniref:Uncharacterized protein n=1 Tax=Salvia splendens TaxID=180675 RepID=A0A8X8YF08_SALSN|nr:hypothetical protein SASPL_108747 [Salvia splendens]
MCRYCEPFGKVLFEDIYEGKSKFVRIDDWYAIDLADSSTRSASSSTNSFTVIDGNESNSSSSNSYVEQRIIKTEPKLSTLKRK